MTRRHRVKRSKRSETVKTVRPTRRLYRLKEGAIYLGISVGSLRRFIQRKEIPVIRSGNVWLVDVVDLNLWIAKNKIG